MGAYTHIINNAFGAKGEVSANFDRFGSK